ncbi:starch-binding protein [Bacteroidia bacterium]|nr:starch-binding protein [Bacteroidia bacterium]
MKKIYYLAMGAMMFCAAGCDDFLDTENLTEKNTANFPQTLADAEQVLAGIYNNLGDAVGVDQQVQHSFLMLSELASDDRFGGGGTGDQILQAKDMLMQTDMDDYQRFWVIRYKGINRANVAIETLGNCEGYTSDAQKDKMLGEAYFMRAFFYYELASMFEKVPLHLESLAQPLPQAEPDAIWGQIVSDLKTAIELMKPAGKTPVSQAGHADAYVAEVMMARAFLFYTGFYGKTDVTLPDGSTVTKQNVIDWIVDCKDNSGYSLVTSDYRNLWAYTNPYTVEEYDYTKGASLNWVESGANNTEAMFAIKFNKQADWSNTSRSGFTNGMGVFCGMRGGADKDWAFPFGQGWGAGPVTPGLWNSFETGDLRREASICHVPTELAPQGYPIGGGDADWIQETDYFIKKTATIVGVSGGQKTDPFDKLLYDMDRQWDVCIIHDLVLMRYAEVLLLHSELTEDAAGINALRDRAGLLPVGYSLAALQQERRSELCFEGLRWNDIRRWGIAETALATQEGAPIYVSALPTTNNHKGAGYAARYTTTKGFVPIPATQIMLSEGLYKQNPGWDEASHFSNW